MSFLLRSAQNRFRAWRLRARSSRIANSKTRPLQHHGRSATGAQLPYFQSQQQPLRRRPARLRDKQSQPDAGSEGWSQPQYPDLDGIYWHEVNYPMDEIEQIEVIRGPSASHWGSNAVNGVINIRSKLAQKTQGSTKVEVDSERALATVLLQAWRKNRRARRVLPRIHWLRRDGRFRKRHQWGGSQ